MKSLSEKITEASDPCTDPDTLRELSELSNKKLHCALALCESFHLVESAKLVET